MLYGHVQRLCRAMHRAQRMHCRVVGVGHHYVSPMPCPFIDALAKQPEYHLDDNDDSNLAIRNTEHKGLELEERFG